MLILVFIVFGWAIFNLRTLGQASEAILQENYRSILAAENMIDSIERQDSGLLLMLLGFEEGQTQFRENEFDFLRWLNRAQDNVTIAGEADVLQRINDGYVEYLTVDSRLLELRAQDPEAATAYYHETVMPIFRSVRDACVELRDMNQEAMVAASNRAQGVSQRAIWSMTAIGAVAAGIGLLFSLILSNRIVQPLHDMAAATEEIARGNYDVDLGVETDDELGHLAERITNMADELKHFHELNVEQVLAEKRRGEAIIRSITDGIVVVDADRRIMAINPKAAGIFDIHPQEAKGQNCFDVIEHQQLYEWVKTEIETGASPAWRDEHTSLSIERDGRTEYYNVTITPVTTEQGKMLGVVLLLQDVTELKELDRLKSEFIMTASHELRTPLTGIGMSISLLKEGAADTLGEREQQLLDAAEEDTQRLRALVNELLDLSKIESGRIDMEIEPAPASLLIEKAIAPFTAQAREQDIELTQETPEEPLEVAADPNKITWVLTNLIANALRYTDPGGHIRVAARRAGDFVHISVTDDGAGIPYEYQSKIFDKFVQVKGDRAAGGTGLGLAICKEIVKAHGGTIWVDSEPGAGSTFTFTLPSADTPQAVEGETIDGELTTTHR